MRQFKLINADGQEFDLMRKDAFLYDPTGFGIGTETQTQRIGDTFVVTETEERKPSPSGIISFEGYAQFEEFRIFIRKGNIVIAYKPINTWCFLNCTIMLEKDEVEKENLRLDCTVKFNGISSWYEKVTEYRSEVDPTKGKIYPYTYSYTYAANLPGVIDVNNGELPSSCKIHILGPCENPTFSISQSEKRIATGKINCMVIQGRKLVINSDPANMEISEYTTDGGYLVDRYAQSDFTTDRIVQIPAGKSRFSFTHDGVGDIIAWVEVAKRV